MECGQAFRYQLDPAVNLTASMRLEFLQLIDEQLRSAATLDGRG